MYISCYCMHVYVVSIYRTARELCSQIPIIVVLLYYCKFTYPKPRLTTRHNPKRDFVFQNDVYIYISTNTHVYVCYILTYYIDSGMIDRRERQKAVSINDLYTEWLFSFSFYHIFCILLNLFNALNSTKFYIIFTITEWELF